MNYRVFAKMALSNSITIEDVKLKLLVPQRKNAE